MKLIIFTTCKPFIGDDAWRQEQAIKSWTLLTGIEKIIIIIGNDKGTQEICDKYNLIHEPNIKTLEGVPYLHSMFEIASSYANEDDYLLWTNSDMIYFNDIIHNVLEFNKIKNEKDIKNFCLVGGRIDWHNPHLLDNFDKNNFTNNLHMNSKKTVEIMQTNSSYHECSQHALCGIDYVIHSNTTYVNNIDKNLVIAGTRHDMILVGTSIMLNHYTCNITNTNLVIHQNHGYNKIKLLHILKKNNLKCEGIQKNISDCNHNSKYDSNNNIIFI